MLKSLGNYAEVLEKKNAQTFASVDDMQREADSNLDEADQALSRAINASNAQKAELSSRLNGQLDFVQGNVSAFNAGSARQRAQVKTSALGLRNLLVLYKSAGHQVAAELLQDLDR